MFGEMTAIAFSFGAKLLDGRSVRLLGTDGEVVYLQHHAQILGVAADGVTGLSVRAPDLFERIAVENGVLLALSGDGAGGKEYVATRVDSGAKAWAHPRQRVLFAGGRLVRSPTVDDACDADEKLIVAASFSGVTVTERASGKERWKSKTVRGTTAAFLGGHVVVADAEKPRLYLLDRESGALLHKLGTSDVITSLSRVGESVVACSFAAAERLSLETKGRSRSLASTGLFDRWPAHLVGCDGMHAVFSNEGEHAIIGSEGPVTWLALAEGEEPVHADLVADGFFGGTTTAGTCWLVPMTHAERTSATVTPRRVVETGPSSVGDWLRGTVLFAGDKSMVVRLETGKNATMPTLRGAAKGCEIYVGEFDDLDRPSKASLTAPTGGKVKQASVARIPSLEITSIQPPARPISARVVKSVRALVDVGLLEAMTEERLWFCANVEWQLESSTPCEIFVSAHASSACTAERGAPCSHRALHVDSEVQSDVDFDADTFGDLQRLLDAASIPLKISAANDGDGVIVTVAARGHKESANLEDTDSSTSTLTALLNRALEKTKSAERFHRVVAKSGTDVVLLLRDPKAMATLGPVLGLAASAQKKSRRT